MRMDQLRYLVDVSETKSMNKTAERLFVSAQAVSKSIKALEEELDTELFVRTNVGVECTRIGASIVALARTMLDTEYSMQQLVKADKLDIRLQKQFPVHICSTSTIVNMILPGVIADVAKQGSNIVPRIDVADNLHDLLESVEQGKCDIGLLTYNEEALFRKFIQYQHSLEMDLLAQDEMVVVMARDSVPEGTETLVLQEFSEHFFSMFSITPADDLVLSTINRRVSTSSNVDFHRAMIEQADACVLMPRRAYEHYFNYDRYVALALEKSSLKLLHAVVYRQDANEGLRTFVSRLRLSMNAL